MTKEKKKKMSSTEKMKTDIRDYLGSPGALSSGQCGYLQEAFAKGDDDTVVVMSGRILDKMLKDDIMRRRLNSFTPHRRCQVSLVREVLKEVWDMRWQVSPVATNQPVGASL